MACIARTPKQIGELLRRRRVNLNLSQGDLATQAGMRQATVSQVENGQPARLQTICDLMEALGLEMTIDARSRGRDIEEIF